MADNDVLNTAEAAALLKVARGTLLNECRAGNVPCQRVGRAWRFNRRALLDWLSSDDTPKFRPKGRPPLTGHRA